MVARAVLTCAVTLVIALSTLAMWRYLSDDEVADFARLAEAESYATRSRLVRDLEMQLRALREVAGYWDSYGRQPLNQWDLDAQIELSHFAGIERIIWSDPAAGVRYATTPEDLALQRRPSDAEWVDLEGLLDGVAPQRGEAMLGPVAGADGHYRFRVVMPSRHRRTSGAVLVAEVDADAALQQLLLDRSPGYAVSVFWGDHELYRRGEPAAPLPESWVRSGLIELTPGPLWRVVHAPLPELAESLHRRAIDGLLVAGLVIAALAGFLIVQNGRVRDRARAAEQAELRLEVLNRDLESQVADRTSELAQQASDLETISESVSHDLRNPLNTVGLNVRLLQESLERGDPTHTTAAIERIDHARAQMADILGRLRSFSQVSFATFQRETVDMTRLVRELFNELSFTEPAPKAELRLGDLPACYADGKLLRILLLNLLGNALKYTRGRDERWVEVGTVETPDRLTYYVRDNGIGFDPARAGELFEPFTQIAEGDGADGQGIGLAVAVRVVHRHGGDIRADGVPGAGATFYFDLGDRGSIRG